MAAKDQPMDEELIKLASGQYDVALPQLLCLTGVGIGKIACLALCTNLTELDLSRNNLASTDGIHEAPQLRKLDLSYNKLARIDHVGRVGALEVLKLQGNLIADVDVLSALAPLTLLRALYLQDRDGGAANPVCTAQPHYGEVVLARLPRLRGLDGHYFFKEELNPKKIDGGDDEEITLPKSVPWLAPGAYPPPNPNAPKPGNATEKQFRAVLAECKDAVAKATL